MGLMLTLGKYVVGLVGLVTAAPAVDTKVEGLIGISTYGSDDDVVAKEGEAREGWGANGFNVKIREGEVGGRDIISPPVEQVVALAVVDPAEPWERATIKLLWEEVTGVGRGVSCQAQGYREKHHLAMAYQRYREHRHWKYTHTDYL